MPKKSKLEEVNDRNKHEFQLQQSSEEKDAGKANKTAKLVSLILDGEKKDLRIFPGQMVWCRFEKTAFWPSMVWSTKAGRITDESKRSVLMFNCCAISRLFDFRPTTSCCQTFRQKGRDCLGEIGKYFSIRWTEIVRENEKFGGRAPHDGKTLWCNFKRSIFLMNISLTESDAK